MDVRDRSDLDPDRLDELVLVRLATSTKPPAAVEVVRALRAFAPRTQDDARWAAAIDDALARLRARGLVDEALAVTSDGRTAAARAGAAAGRTWKQLAGKALPARGLGLAADDTKALAKLKDRDAWVAAVLGRAHGLWTDGAPPSLGAIGDALIWKRLALPGRPARTPAALRAHFVGLELGTGTAAKFEQRAAQLAASVAGAPRADLGALREALVRRWLGGQAWPTRATAPEAATASELPAASPPDFAATVRTAAARATDGVFGPRKVFIASLWRDPAFHDLPLAEFKQRLLDAHRAGTVTLARADLVAAMDPELVRESETPHQDTRYHFVERGGAP